MNNTPAITSVLAQVGPRLKRLRAQRGVTLAALAEATGISKSTLSRLESGQRRPSLEVLLPIALAHQVPLDELVAAPEVGDPRVHIAPRRVNGRTILPLTRQPGGLQAFKITIPATQNEPDLRVHDGYEWLYVLSGRLRLILADHDLHARPRPALPTRNPPQPLKPSPPGSCTRLETMRDALTRHQQWCAAEDLTGTAYEQQRAHLAADVATELDRWTAWARPAAGMPAMPRRPPRSGDVWTIKGGVMGPEPWLIVSNDLYLELSEDNMLAVPIRDASRPGSRVVTEPIPDVGQAVLDRITALPRAWLIGEDPVAALHPDRHAEVGRRICNLIGP